MFIFRKAIEVSQKSRCKIMIIDQAFESLTFEFLFFAHLVNDQLSRKLIALTVSVV